MTEAGAERIVVSHSSSAAPTAPAVFLPVRILRRLANSRELTLVVLIVALGGTMAIVYPANFPTAYNFSAAQRSPELHPRHRNDAADDRWRVRPVDRFDLALAGVASAVASAWGWPPVPRSSLAS